MKIRLPFVLLLASVALVRPGLAADAASRLSDYVRPFVGTQGEGNTFPGPSAPFGMMQLSPDTDTRNWDTDSGYEYADPTILGFSLTHLSGTGCPDLGDFLFVPQVGTPSFVPGTKEHPEDGYQSAFSHGDETAAVGYYKVKLRKPGVTAELTAGERAGILRFTFPASEESSILTDLGRVIDGGRWHIAQSHVRIEDASTITGFHLVNGWNKERSLYFAARYSRPFDEGRIVSDGAVAGYRSYLNYRFRSRNEAAGTNVQFLAKFKTRADEVIQVKVAVSSVSAANALQNLEAEIPAWDFEKVREQTRLAWDHELSRLQVEGSPEQKETFYTSLYHAFLTPNLGQDSNGDYRGFDQGVHRAEGFVRHTVFSLWDTFRAEHPLLSLIQRERDGDMINSLLAHYDQSADHLLPMWELQGGETWCMIGYHAAPVIADGYLNGVRGFDAEHAYQAMRATAMNPDYDGLASYRKLGWVPCDEEDESLSKTLEYAYDDWSIARMAKALGKTADYELFMRRAANYKNLYDASTGWMGSKDSAGRWRPGFDPHLFGGGVDAEGTARLINGLGVATVPQTGPVLVARSLARQLGTGIGLADVTEATSSQYSWFAPQDVPGLIELMGGREKFVEKLDSLFEAKPSEKFIGELSANDLRGCIGEYWHGNEPSHHVIYLYCYAGQPWKAAERLHQVVTTQYGNGPGSLCGNDDCGQMSAWYLFACMGFYPVCPASGYYVIGAPQVPATTMHLSNGKTFTMKAENLSPQNIYVQSVRVNGKEWDSPFLPHREVESGGSIEFTMGPQPNKEWGTHGTVPE